MDCMLHESKPLSSISVNKITLLVCIKNPMLAHGMTLHDVIVCALKRLRHGLHTSTPLICYRLNFILAFSRFMCDVLQAQLGLDTLLSLQIHPDV